MLIVHPTGNANVRHAALTLHEAGLLEEFWTSIAVFPGSIWEGISGLPGLKAIKRRTMPSVLARHTYQRPILEVARLASMRFGLGSLFKEETSVASIDAVYRRLDRTVSKRLRKGEHVAAVYAYEDGALEAFKACKERQITTIYDLPIGYWRVAHQIYREEAERLPAWGKTIPGLNDSTSKLARKDEELSLADMVIVASSFTARTLNETPFSIPDPVVIPYGCESPTANVKAERTVSDNRNEPLKVLFVGSLSQRKGIYELFRAVEALRDRVQLTLLGRRVGDCVERDEALIRHRWIESLSQGEVLRLMAEHDVFVFPSLFEGFGLVLTEALSQGLPVITTSHTAGPDILDDGQDGFIVPIRNWEAIAEKLELLDKDRDRLAEMKSQAYAKARQLTWARYRRDLEAAVRASMCASKR